MPQWADTSARDIGQQCLGHLQQLRPGEQIEKLHCLELARLVADTADMLLRSELRITITQGWPSRSLAMLSGNNILPISVVSLLLIFQTLTQPSTRRCGLTQCHSG